MAEILPSASYLRTADFPGKPRDESVVLCLCEQHQLGPPEASLRIWELLETPQTIETICRVLAHEYALPAQTCSAEVRALLAQLYDEDLIQVSPDT